jgi:hypothetical protein
VISILNNHRYPKSLLGLFVHGLKRCGFCTEPAGLLDDSVIGAEIHIPEKAGKSEYAHEEYALRMGKCPICRFIAGPDENGALKSYCAESILTLNLLKKIETSYRVLEKNSMNFSTGSGR